jgi:hypothetical protein
MHPEGARELPQALDRSSPAAHIAAIRWPILRAIRLADTVWSQWFCQLRLKYEALPPSGGSYDPFTLARNALLSILRFESYAQRSMLLIRIGRRGGLQAQATDPIHLP